jgi:hypothetical protein
LTHGGLASIHKAVVRDFAATLARDRIALGVFPSQAEEEPSREISSHKETAIVSPQVTGSASLPRKDVRQAALAAARAASK